MKKFLVNILCGLIPSKSLRHKIRNRILTDKKNILENIKPNKCLIQYKNDIPDTINHHYITLENTLKTIQEEIILSRLQNRVMSGKKIRFGFYVIYDSTFPAAPLFELLQKDENYEPFILVIPDVLRGEEHMFHQVNQTFEVLSKKYKNVYKSYDEKTKSFIDFQDKVDIVFFANPYDQMTHEYYRIETAANNNILTCCTYYGYITSNLLKSMYNSTTFKKLWKIFLLNRYEENLLKANDNNGTNGVLSGYCKMDKLATIKEKTRKRKKIIISPHHTVAKWENGLNLSNFVHYSEFFIDLFKKYPDIDFVFRPHQLLWINLINSKIWSKQQIDSYLAKITALPNVEYQNGGEYFDTFVNSDALIHDCGSFSAEYLFVNKPCCYLLKDDITNQQNFNEFHKKCIECHYPAYNEQDIINFIENIVIKGNDTKSDDRTEFAKKELILNYPNVSQSIYEYINKKLGI